MQTPSAQPSGPGAIMRLATAFYGSKTLLAAVNMGLFEWLASHGPATADEVGEKLRLHPRGVQDFLDALVALELLDRTGGAYRATSATSEYLDPAKADRYIGGFLKMYNNHLFPLWTHFEESLRTGKPVLESPEIFDELYEMPEAKKDFLAAMDTVTRLATPGIIGALDWRKYRSFVDVGGAGGTLSGALARRFPELEGICYDLPTVRQQFEKLIAEQGLTSRVRFQAGNFFTEPLPSTDVIIFGHILHDWDVDRRRSLIRSAYQALRPGGVVLVYDAMIDDDRRAAAGPLLLSLNMLVVSPGGSQYTFADCKGWLTEAGFEDVMHTSLGMESLVIGAKPE
jgi:SAM-dependent methyltransferase